MHRRRSTRPLAVLVAAIALLAAGCLQLPGSVGTPTGPKVIVIGDSFVLNAAPQITNLLVAGGYNVTVFGHERLNTAEALELIDQAVERGPAAVVVITTANDATSLTPGRSVEDGARTFFEVRDTLAVAFAKLDGVPCTGWMLVDEDAQAFYRLGETAPIANGLVSALAATRPKAHLLDWRHLLAAHPEYALADRLHVNDLGNQRLAQDINGAVAGCHT